MQNAHFLSYTIHLNRPLLLQMLLLRLDMCIRNWHCFVVVALVIENLLSAQIKISDRVARGVFLLRTIPVNFLQVVVLLHCLLLELDSKLHVSPWVQLGNFALG